VALPPIGFWSYSTHDDDQSNGRIARLHDFAERELRQKFGRGQTVEIWRDTSKIRSGQDWEARINEAVDRASFLIAVVTPDFLDSVWCRHEVMRFHARVAATGRTDLLFPLHLVNTDDLDHDEVRHPELLDLLRVPQMLDFRAHRRKPTDHPDVEAALDQFTTDIRVALRVGRERPGSKGPGGARVGATSGDAVGNVTRKPSEAPTIPVPDEPPPPAVATEIALAAPAIMRAPAEPVPGTVERDGPNYPEMVLIPAGGFLMGVPEAESKREGATDDNARPVHHVRIARPFWLGKYPLTRGEYQAFVMDAGYDADGAAWLDPGFPQTDRDPVVNISHADAMAYAAWLAEKTGKPYRLPSEAEWEYAARAGTLTTRFWGNAFEGWKDYAVTSESGTKTVPVEGRKPNPFGLHDMLGHVWEWCADPWHDTYVGGPTDGSAWTTNGDTVRRVLRGGSWNDDPRFVRSGVRGDDVSRDYDIGCRLARTSF